MLCCVVLDIVLLFEATRVWWWHLCLMMLQLGFEIRCQCQGCTIISACWSQIPVMGWDRPFAAAFAAAAAADRDEDGPFGVNVACHAASNTWCLSEAAAAADEAAASSATASNHAVKWIGQAFGPLEQCIPGMHCSRQGSCRRKGATQTLRMKMLSGAPCWGPCQLPVMSTPAAWAAMETAVTWWRTCVGLCCLACTATGPWLSGC